MKEKDLIHHCRYYRGERNNPHQDDNKAMLWMYEKDWLLSMLKGYNDRDKPSILDSYLNEYSLAGLSQFEAQDSIPVTLKALLFNLYAKQSHSLISAAEGFKEFYKKYYKSEEVG